MDSNSAPAYLRRKFTCPHCGAFAQQEWARCSAVSSDSDIEFSPGLAVATCMACQERSVWRLVPPSDGMPGYSGVMIYPAARRGGPPRHPDMPEKVAEFYDEASEVVPISPRAAAALLRLALEALLKDSYSNEGSLSKMIGAAVRDGLPAEVQQSMDYVRFRGNSAAHELHTGDDKHVATVLFEITNVIVDRLIAQPKKISSLYASLPENFREHVDKRDGKS